MFDDSKSRLKKLAEFGGEVAVVPYSGVQILDFGSDENASQWLSSVSL